MERPDLWPLYRPANRIDAVQMSPNPGDMGQLYIDMRTDYPDGMALACATPRRDYNKIVADYATQSRHAGFDYRTFWHNNFTMPEFTGTSFEGKIGMTVDEYTLAIRGLFKQLTTNKESRHVQWLPYEGLVAGIGRFSMHNFMWDGYHMLKGYAADGRPADWQTILNVIANTAYQIETIGFSPNGNADFYLTRPQPPYFSHEISMLADNENYGDEALIHYLPVLEKEYQGYWMDGYEGLRRAPDDGQIHTHRSLVRIPLGNGDFAFLNRYWDDADGPRLESYLEDVEIGDKAAHGRSGDDRAKKLAKIYKDLRAGAASGWDYSSRWFADGQNISSINTTDIAPVDLNCLINRMEQVLARAHKAAAEQSHLTEDQRDAHLLKSTQYTMLAARRAEAISKLMWDPREQIFRDYNFTTGKQTGVMSAAMSYPLYVGIASPEQAFGVANATENHLLQKGGIITTTGFDIEQQWDGGNVWAPPNWATARGLARTAHMLMSGTAPLHANMPYVVSQHERSQHSAERLLDLANRSRLAYMAGIQAVYAAQGVVPEKHNGFDPSQLGGGGEYDVVKILGMPSEIYRAMRVWDPRDPRGNLPIGPPILPRT